MNANTFEKSVNINSKTDKRKDQEWMEQKSKHYDALIANRYGVDFASRVRLAFIYESIQLQVLRKQVLYNTLLSGITNIEVATETINRMLDDEFLSQDIEWE